jgi:hypothetical protein
LADSIDSILSQQSIPNNNISLDIGQLNFQSKLTETTIKQDNTPFNKINQAISENTLSIMPINGLSFPFVIKQEQSNVYSQTLNLSEEKYSGFQYQNSNVI